MPSAFCVRACRSLGGVQRSRGQITIGIALNHSTRLLFPAQFACALFVLDIAGDGAKSLTGKAKPESLQRRRVKSPEALLAKVLGGVAWMELHAVLAVKLESCAKPGFARLGLLCILVEWRHSGINEGKKGFQVGKPVIRHKSHVAP